RDAMAKIVDGQHGGVAPEPAALQQRGATAAHGLDVVAQLEESVTGRALKPVSERMVAPALDAREPDGERLRHARPHRSRSVETISSSRWRSVCSARARRRALSPMARA